MRNIIYGRLKLGQWPIINFYLPSVIKCNLLREMSLFFRLKHFSNLAHNIIALSVNYKMLRTWCTPNTRVANQTK